MSTTEKPASAAPATASRATSAGIILSIILVCQLMIGLDATIVNVALPKVQGALHFSTVGASWVLNIYALAFGGLVLFGGRTGDILGRRRVFLSGVILFTLASLAGGLSTTGWELVLARGLQGVGAALAAPSALALLMINFPDPARRTKAMSYYSITMALGTTVGLILGGVLVSFASWRWVLFVNVPVGIVIAILTPIFLKTAPARDSKFDVAGAITSTAGVGLLIYGFIHGTTNGWGNSVTMGALIGAVVLLAAFFVIESRVSQPVTPLWLFKTRNRAAGYVHIFLLMAAMYGLYFFGTQFMENDLHYGPLKTGLAFLVTTLAATIAARGVAKLLPRFGAKPVLIVGASCTVVGSILMTQLSASSGYLTGLVPSLLLFGLGMGLSFPSLNVAILAGVPPQESGAAAGLLQAMQFVGGTIGLSVLVTIFGLASQHLIQHPPSGATSATLGNLALSHGIASAYIAGIVFTVCTLLLAVFVMQKPKAAATTKA